MLPWQTLQTSTDCQTNSYGTVDQTGQTLPEFANAKVSTQVEATSLELVECTNRFTSEPWLRHSVAGG